MQRMMWFKYIGMGLVTRVLKKNQVTAIAEFRCQRVRAFSFELYLRGDRPPVWVRYTFASGRKNYWMTRQNTGLVSTKETNFRVPCA